jgi:hypothetical protein
MPRGPKWSTDENEFLTGMLQTYGNEPRKWTEEVRQVVFARLASRSESGIYQQALKILKGRKTDVVPATPLSLATGA